MASWRIRIVSRGRFERITAPIIIIMVLAVLAIIGGGFIIWTPRNA